jgi:N-acetylglucosaminyldiphosphoundecaprenol N-acetyl-beta-D-mannosaminyltransferase
MNILGIPIDNFSREEILDCVRDFLNEPKFHRLVTVNPEFLLEAEKNEAFRKSLLEADMRVTDGFGIVLAGWLRGKYITRFPGADLMEEILKIANEKKLSVFLVVNKDGLSSYEEVQTAILKKYPDIILNGTNISCHSERSFESRNLDMIENIPQQARDDIIKNYQLVFCNFGAPEQELFLAKLKEQNMELRLAMGVGGSFDYLTGKQKRAPEWLRVIGLEWLWRLILQPKRFKRIWNATVVFLARSLKKSHTCKIR